jgi:hypothetical protein
VTQDDLAKHFIEAFFDRWPDYAPHEVREGWERDLRAAFARTLPKLEEHFAERLLSDEAIRAGAQGMFDLWSKPGNPTSVDSAEAEACLQAAIRANRETT